MGWKTVKDHYDIKHIVQVDTRKEYGDVPVIMIGSPYISDIIVIRISDGKILRRYEDGRTNELLRALQPRLDEDEKTGKLKELIAAPDTFHNVKPVYYIGDHMHVQQMFCEHYGWPNVTVDGKLMYENEFFSQRRAAVHYLVQNTHISWKRWWYYGVKQRMERIVKEVRAFFRWEIREILESIYVRCWGRFFVKKGGVK